MAKEPEPKLTKMLGVPTGKSTDDGQLYINSAQPFAGRPETPPKPKPSETLKK